MLQTYFAATTINLDVNAWVAVASFVLTLFTTSLGALVWYASSEKKKYAAERDFQHLKNNQLQMSQGLDLILKTIDTRADIIERDINEIRITLNLKGKKSD